MRWRALETDQQFNRSMNRKWGIVRRIAMFCLAIVAAFDLWAADASFSNRLDLAVAAIRSGDFVAAESNLNILCALASKQGDLVGEATARRWLAQALSQKGPAFISEATNQLALAETALLSLSDGVNMVAGQQLGYVLFAKAEILRQSAELVMREQRTGGYDPSRYFDMIQQYVAPAESALKKATPLYASGQLADLDNARGELLLLQARLAAAFLPSGADSASYEKACLAFEKARSEEIKRGLDARTDLLLSIPTRLAEIRRERALQIKDPVERRRQLRMAAESLDNLGTNKEISQHRELAAYGGYMKALCLLDAEGADLTAKSAGDIERDLLSAANEIENIQQQSGGGSFESKRSCFSPRTHVYEALALLYFRSGQSEKMLQAIERMKARAFMALLDDNSATDLSLAALQSRLKREKAVLAEYFFGPDHAWIIVIRGEGKAKVVPIACTSQELVHKIRNVLAGFSDQAVLRRQLDSLRKQRGNISIMKQAYQDAADLYRLLIVPVTEGAETNIVRRLYVVPHHIMNYLPFNALVTSLDTNALVASSFYVQEGMPVTYLPSAATLLEIGENPLEGPSYVYARSDFKTVEPLFPVDLPNTVPEAAAAAGLLSAQVRLEKDATEESLRQITGSCSVLYFATHGVLDKQDTMKSALLLAKSGTATGHECDGMLSVEELMTDMRGRLSVDLVVLSACLTNRGEPDPSSGDDIAAVSRAFLVAGARSVLATQGVASDDTFPIIVGQFMTAIRKDRLPKDVALQLSQRDFLARLDTGVFRYPLFWAPIILLGAGD